MSARSNGTDEEQYPDHDLRCGNCGYKWRYTGEMWRATCPRCGGKVKTEHYGQ